MRITRSKIRMNTFSVDSDIAIAIGEEAHAGYSRLAPSHTVVILAFDGFGQGRFSSSLLCLIRLQQRFRARPEDRLLSLVWMLRTSINLQATHNLRSQAIMHHHTTHCMFQCTLWMFAFQCLAQGRLLQTTGILRVAIVDLLLHTSSRNSERLRIDHNHKIPAIHMGSERGLVLPTQEDRKSTRLNSSHRTISYAVFCLKKK